MKLAEKEKRSSQSGVSDNSASAGNKDNSAVGYQRTADAEADNSVAVIQSSRTATITTMKANVDSASLTHTVPSVGSLAISRHPLLN